MLDRGDDFGGRLVTKSVIEPGSIVFIEALDQPFRAFGVSGDHHAQVWQEQLAEEQAVLGVGRSGADLDDRGLDPFEFRFGTGENAHIDGLIQARARGGQVQTILPGLGAFNGGNPGCGIGNQESVFVVCPVKQRMLHGQLVHIAVLHGVISDPPWRAPGQLVCNAARPFPLP